MGSIRGLVASFVVLGGLVGTAEAAVYQFALNVEAVAFPEPCIGQVPNTIFGCVSPGDKFLGSFVVSDSALLTDGIKDNGVSGFVLDVGLVHYPNIPAGFRDSNLNIGSRIGIRIVGGQVDSFVGGVFSSRDVPFVDFARGNFGRFEAADLMSDHLSGTVTITQVPEPGLLLLVGLGAACGIASRRRWWS